ncbi:MAG: hypothetical protein PHY45_11855 [Rhodocyclaceae bacterium]|nr:hypothetical protein [Rhodocyclaceae bacterium]
MATVQNLVDALAAGHRGHDRGISAIRLAARLDIPPRMLRELIAQANMEGHAVGGHPRRGYFMAANPEEAKEIAYHLIHRAKFGLLRASRILGKPILELAGQMTLDDVESQQGAEPCQQS